MFSPASRVANTHCLQPNPTTHTQVLYTRFQTIFELGRVERRRVGLVNDADGYLFTVVGCPLNVTISAYLVRRGGGVAGTERY